MSAKSPESSGLQIVIARYERRIGTVRRIQELIEDDPLLASEIVAALNGQKPPTQEREHDRPRHFDAIRAFFEDREHAWTPTPEIHRSLGLGKGSVSQVLYDKKHSKKSEKRPKPGNKKVVMWRLRKETE